MNVCDMLNNNLILVCMVGLVATVGMITPYGIQTADAKVITYRIHSDILTELQDRYPDYAEDYWESVKEAIRDGISAWTELNPEIIVTPSHDDRHDVLIEWIDSEYAWGVEYHDSSLGYRIGIDFDSPEPDMYGASLMNPDIVRYVMAHELGHVLGMGHSASENHLMHGTANPTPDRAFDNLGYTVPRLVITNFGNIGGDRLDVSFHLQGYHVHDVAIVDVNGTEYLVASTGDDGLHILNMSNPDHPELMDSDDEPSVDIWPIDGQPYVIQMYSNGFRVLDLTDPANITLAGTVHHNAMLDAVLVNVGGTPLVIMVSKGLIHQYDVSDPYDIRRSGILSDGFHLLGVKHIHGIAREDESTYILVDASFDGIQTYLIQPDRNPARTWDRLDDVQQVNLIYDTVEIDGITYHMVYTQGHIGLYEGESDLEVVGRLIGYTALGIDTLRVDGTVYGVIAVGQDGILGIHIDDEGTGKWTVG